MHCVGVGGQGPKRGLCFESAQLQAANAKNKSLLFSSVRSDEQYVELQKHSGKISNLCCL